MVYWSIGIRLDGILEYKDKVRYMYLVFRVYVLYCNYMSQTL